ncbi:MAG TPA: BTAD domain-containing putative transcriptional regulator [Candidatus Binatia bacterium]|nr:BTAD domain-containing putative transcriptional regulator [Candidatus Binatia bacterium]
MANQPPAQVRLFGSVQICCEGTRIEHRLSTTTQLLFAMLVTGEGDVLKREEIAFTLWPDLPESEARANLRRHLYLLQRALPGSTTPWIQSDAKTITWGAGERPWVDVNDFKRLSATPDGIEAAVELYRGDFMQHADHEWAAAVRERLRAMFCKALDLAVSRRRERHDPTGALRYIEQLLAYDPWREDALRDLMISRSRIGDRVGALAFYQKFCHRIRAEFGVEPMPETVQCREMVARGEAHASR